MSGDVLRSKEVPAEAGDFADATGETGAGGGVVDEATTQSVADEGFDRVGFVEGQRDLPPPEENTWFSSARLTLANSDRRLLVASRA